MSNIAIQQAAANALAAGPLGYASYGGAGISDIIAAGAAAAGGGGSGGMPAEVVLNQLDRGGAAAADASRKEDFCQLAEFYYSLMPKNGQIGKLHLS